MTTAAKPKTAAQIRRQIKAAIDRRISPASARAGATKTQLRRALHAALHPVNLTRALEIAGLDMATATADQLHELNYGLAWCRAYNKQLAEFYATPWGVDTGAEAETQLAFAA